MDHAVKNLGVSERRACKILFQIRGTQRYRAVPNPEQSKLRDRVLELATLYGRYGYRQITNLLNAQGWRVGKDRVYTIWREEGLKVPQKQPKRARLWLASGSCIRLRPEYRNHVWSYDFVSYRTHDGRVLRILNILDEYSRVCLCSYVARRIRSGDIIFILADLFLKYGFPRHIRSDNGPEFIARKLIKWLKHLEVTPTFIEPGSPWENGYIESFNGKMRYELLNGEIFYTLLEARIVIEQWRIHYNQIRPHSSLSGKAPAPESKLLDMKLVS